MEGKGVIVWSPKDARKYFEGESKRCVEVDTKENRKRKRKEESNRLSLSPSPLPFLVQEFSADSLAISQGSHLLVSSSRSGIIFESFSLENAKKVRGLF